MFKICSNSKTDVRYANKIDWYYNEESRPIEKSEKKKLRKGANQELPPPDPLKAGSKREPISDGAFWKSIVFHMRDEIFPKQMVSFALVL